MMAAAVGISLTANAGNFKMDEQELEQLFTNSTEVGFDHFFASSVDLQGNMLSGLSVQEGKTRGGYLIRSFFCGSIALHRYYMGTTRKGMWAMYCCIPVVGGLTGFVDFWWAVFEADAYQKYANNDKYIDWLN